MLSLLETGRKEWDNCAYLHGNWRTEKQCSLPVAISRPVFLLYNPQKISLFTSGGISKYYTRVLWVDCLNVKLTAVSNIISLTEITLLNPSLIKILLFQGPKQNKKQLNQPKCQWSKLYIYIFFFAFCFDLFHRFVTFSPLVIPEVPLQPFEPTHWIGYHQRENTLLHVHKIWDNGKGWIACPFHIFIPQAKAADVACFELCLIFHTFILE